MQLRTFFHGFPPLYPGLRWLAVAAALSACSSKPPVAAPPPALALQGTAEPAINPDAQGSPLSVVVRLYQLRDFADFSTLNFDAIASGRGEESLLGPQLIRKQEWIAAPGREFASPLSLDPETRYVGVAALFRHPHPQYWRYLVTADALRTAGGMNLRVGPCYLSVQSPRPLQLPGQSAGAAPSCDGRSVAAPTRFPSAGTAAMPSRAGAMPPAATPAAPLPTFSAPVGSPQALTVDAVKQETPGLLNRLLGRTPAPKP